MSDPRHARTRGHSRYYTFDNGEVPSFSTIKNHIASYQLNNWNIERAIDRAIALSTTSLRERHRAFTPDAKGRRLKSPSVAKVKAALEADRPEADTGTAAHEAFETWFNTGHVPPGPDGVDPYIEQAIDFAMTVNPRPLYLEPEVYHPRLRYAGSADWIFEIDGATCLGDTKTGGVFFEAAMQLVAYSSAKRLYPRGDGNPCRGGCKCEWEPVPTVDRLLVLDLKPGSWELLEVDPDVIPLLWKTFQGALTTHQMKRLKPTEIFAPVRLTQEEAA